MGWTEQNCIGAHTQASESAEVIDPTTVHFSVGHAEPTTTITKINSTICITQTFKKLLWYDVYPHGVFK